MLLRLHNTIQRYDWGSTHALPQLLGTEPDGTPQAELWMGAHPAAPSLGHVKEGGVGAVKGDGGWCPLDALIRADPPAMVGPAVVARYGPALPFLLKVLAVARPLSLQVHPTAAQARDGFARESANGIDATDPGRTYRDTNHKPELVCAVSAFDMVTGFRETGAAAALLEAFTGGGNWGDTVRGEGLAAALWRLWDLDPEGRDALLHAVEAAATPAQPVAVSHPAEAALVRRLAALHPGDVGAVVTLLMNRVTVPPGRSVFAPAGRLHAYLDGTGVEIMASSDNVVRAGLTTKRVDLVELRRLLDVTAEEVMAASPVIDERSGEELFASPAAEFLLSRLAGGAVSVALASAGPEIAFCLDGAMTLTPPQGEAVVLAGGESVFVPASEPRYHLEGAGTLFRARVAELVDDAAGTRGGPATQP